MKELEIGPIIVVQIAGISVRPTAKVDKKSNLKNHVNNMDRLYLQRRSVVTGINNKYLEMHKALRAMKKVKCYKDLPSSLTGLHLWRIHIFF